MALGEYVPFWNRLTERQKRLMRERAKKETYEKGMVLFAGAGSCSGLLIVTSGQLRVFTLSGEGRELTLYRLFEGDVCLLSGSCIVQNIQFEVRLLAEQDTVVYRILPEVYKNLMEQSTEVSMFTNELMASRFSHVMWLMDQVLYKKMDSRLAAFLLEEGRLNATRELSITHEQIAGHLGTAREVVSRLLKLFQEEKLVKISRGGVSLLDEDGLQALAADSLRHYGETS